MKIASKKEERGLNENNRNLIVVFVFIVLLLFGPIESYGLFVRIMYLILVPVFLWLILRFWGGKLPLDKQLNNYLNRGIYALIAGMLIVSAYISFITKNHTVCDQLVQTRDGQECVGDYVLVNGPDVVGVVMQIIFAGILFWLAVSKRKDGEDI